MSPEQLFSLCGMLVLPGWLHLLALVVLYAACVFLIFRQAMHDRPLLSLGAFVL